MRATAIFLVVLGFTFGHSIAAYAQLDSQTNTQAGAQALVGKTEVSEQGSASTSTSAESRPANAELSSGTTVNAVLQTPVDSKKAKSGDRVDARTTEAVTSDGKTVLPKRTKLVGHVTRASARAKGDAESTLAIAFDRAVLKKWP